MNEATSQTTACPLLERLLSEKGIRLNGIYTNKDAANTVINSYAWLVRSATGDEG